jgi:hypothetical protein
MAYHKFAFSKAQANADTGPLRFWETFVAGDHLMNRAVNDIYILRIDSLDPSATFHHLSCLIRLKRL